MTLLLLFRSRVVAEMSKGGFLDARTVEALRKRLRRRKEEKEPKTEGKKKKVKLLKPAVEKAVEEVQEELSPILNEKLLKTPCEFLMVPYRIDRIIELLDRLEDSIERQRYLEHLMLLRQLYEEEFDELLLLLLSE